MHRVVAIVLLGALLLTGCVESAPAELVDRAERYGEIRDLPPVVVAGATSLEEVMGERRSDRSFAAEELSPAELGQLFWAAQGTTSDAGYRTAPSAGALYPLEIYAATATEIQHYLPGEHRVEVGAVGDLRERLAAAAFGQDWIGEAAVVFVITGVAARSEAKYAAVAPRLVDREAGHAAQNLLLQATALGFSAVPVGGFDPAAVSDLLLLPAGEEPLYLLPVG